MAHRWMNRAGVPAFLAAAAAVAAISCSGSPKDPAGAVGRMVKAHGGLEAVERLGGFAARGFIRDLSDTIVVKSNSFDLYRLGNRYKHVVMMAPAGTLTGIIALSYDGETAVEWTSRTGRHAVSGNELQLLPYRFPAVIAWASEHARSGAIVDGSGKGDRELRLRYEVGDSLLTISIDRSSWLLAGVDLASAADTLPGYSERYDTYMDVDGLPFPSRFTGRFRGFTYYEYLLSKVEFRSDLPDSLFRLNAADTIRIARSLPVPAKKE